MKYESWRREKGSVFSLDTKQFEPLFRLKAILDNFKRIDPSTRTMSWIAGNLRATINNQQISYDAIIDPTPVYRGQVLSPEESLRNASRLWYPPINKIQHMGRLNRKGQQVFYCSSNLKGMLFEVDPKPFELIGILECELVSDHPTLNMVQLGIDRSFLSRTKNAQGVGKLVETAEQRHHSKLVIDGIPIGELSESFIIQKFFHEMLSHKPEDNNHDFYKITIAIADMWFENPAIAGIAYPGIATKFPDGNYMTGHNLALRKEIVDLYYRPSRVWLCKCSLLTKKGFGLEVLKSSDRIDELKNIRWSDVAIALPTLP